jgi:hypothetical protein
MRLTLLLLLSVFTTPLLSHAEFKLIYRVNSSGIGVGAGTFLPEHIGGYFAWNPDTNEAVQVSTTVIRGKKYVIMNPVANQKVTVLSGPRGTSYTAITVDESPSTQYKDLESRGLLLLGLNRSLKFGVKTLVAPAAFLGSVHNLSVVESANAEVLEVRTGSFTLDRVATNASNDSDESITGFVNRMITQYENKGFSLLPQPAPAN